MFNTLEVGKFPSIPTSQALLPGIWPMYGLVFSIPRLGHTRMLALWGQAVVVEPRAGHIGAPVVPTVLWAEEGE